MMMGRGVHCWFCHSKSVQELKVERYKMDVDDVYDVHYNDDDDHHHHDCWLCHSKSVQELKVGRPQMDVDDVDCGWCA